MNVVSACRRRLVLWLLLPMLVAAASARDARDSAAAEAAPMPPSRTTVPATAVRRLPSTGFEGGAQLNYLGVYPADGKFRSPSALDKLRSERPWWTRATETQEMRPVEVPPSIQLRSIERVVEDYEPPARAVSAVRQGSALRAGGHGLVRLVYGRENVLRAPTYLTTDSQGRVIITDPALPGIHVLGSEGQDSFRIMGGPDHRLRRPAGTAVDDRDNIYVADSARAMIFVYAPDGTFLRRIGELAGGETFFYAPTEIAIDRAAGHLYVLDRSRILMLDLDGTVLKRAGKQRSPGATPEFEAPSDLALANDGIVVLDANGSRIQLMDLSLKLRQKWNIPPLSTANPLQRVALSVDSSGHIYVTCPSRSQIRVFRQDGSTVGDFGVAGSDIAQFSVPAGIWVDSRNRVYVSDRNNRRVQVFQIEYPPRRERGNE